MKRLAKAAEPRPTRVRRSAADARSAILDAAERKLVAHGPAAIRLQEVAAEVGVSHPTILHHFGSRERLVAEVVKRRVDVMNADVLAAVASEATGHEVVAGLLERLFAMFGPGGHARVVAFLALAGAENPSLDGLRLVSRALHARRVAKAEPGARPSLEESDFIVQLTAFALFGEAIAGPLFRGESADAPDTKARARFLAGLTQLVETSLQGVVHVREDDAPHVAQAPPVRLARARKKR